MTDELATIAPMHTDDLAVWVQNAKHAHELATLLVTTSFVPASYEGRADQAAAAILTGLELGMSPVAALRSIDVIKGTPAMRAIALRAVVQANGHEIWTEESTATRAIVAGRRRSSDKVERSTWTIERARQAGLAGKDNYRNQPIAMLLARATSELARLIAADALLGIPYSVEEIEDGAVELVPAEKPGRATSTTTKLRRRSLDTVGTANDRRRSLSSKESDESDSDSAESTDDALSVAESDSDAAESSSATEHTSEPVSVAESDESDTGAAVLADEIERSQQSKRAAPADPVPVEMPPDDPELDEWLRSHKPPESEGDNG